MPIEIAWADQRWKRVPRFAPLLARAHAVSLSKVNAAKTTALLLADDHTTEELNKQWRGQNKPTNVLAFPAGSQIPLRGQPRILGDVVLSYDTCAREARAGRLLLRDHALHLVVHGLLHLVGFDHENDADANKMEAREIRILTQLGIANPYML